MTDWYILEKTAERSNWHILAKHNIKWGTKQETKSEPCNIKIKLRKITWFVLVLQIKPDTPARMHRANGEN